MREAERALVRKCIDEDKDMLFEEIIIRTGLPPDKVSGYISDVVSEAGNWSKFFGEPIDNAPIESPWDIVIDDDLLDKYKKEIDDKTNKIKPMLTMKLYMEFERDKQIAQGKLDKLKNSAHQGSRWLELKLKARNEQIKLLGLDAAQELNVNVGVNRTKEERDAIFRASQARNLLPSGVI